MRAFSLVELSIVLVILGLLTGGILAGQSLIRAAEIRSVSVDMAQYQTAIYNFRDRYAALPGDIPNATSIWGSVSLDGAACPDGQGTGTHTCDGNDDRILTHREGFRLWQHLANAGLVSGSYSGVYYDTSTGAKEGVNSPLSKLGPNTTVTIKTWGPHTSTDADNYPMESELTMRFGDPLCGSSSSRGSARCPVLRPEEAWNIDTKLDDGKPAEGKLRSYKRSTSLTPNCTSSDDPTNADYNVGNRSILCAIYLIL